MFSDCVGLRMSINHCPIALTAQKQDTALYLSLKKILCRVNTELNDAEHQHHLRQTRLSSVALMPPPFAWVEIPGGSGTMQTMRQKEPLQIPTKSYLITKYPVTNAQYAKFIEADGYEREGWWTPEGWAARQKQGWTQPRFWQDELWNRSETPVVGVSWFEALAFCTWLTEETGEHIVLPTEAQWQYAAQGTDGRKYPWGDEWDGARCNQNFSLLGRNRPGHTTPVREYEGKGDSPFGVVDMAGNVWEWCLTVFKDGHDVTLRGLRGGSWSSQQLTDDFRCDRRYRGSHHSRSFIRGFRLAAHP